MIPKVREKILAEAIDEDNLQARQTSSGEELHYAPNQEQPYTGWIKRNHSLQQFRRGRTEWHLYQLVWQRTEYGERCV